MLARIAAVARRKVRSALFVCSVLSFWAGSRACGDGAAQDHARSERTAVVDLRA